MNADDALFYPLVPVFDHRWLRLKGEVMLELAQGLKGRMRWYFEHCLGIPWNAVAFDSDYFAEKMREARKRKQEAEERNRCLVPNRDRIQTLTSDIDDKDFEIIDQLFGDSSNGFGMSKDLLLAFYKRPEFHLELHKQAILAALQENEILFDDLPEVVVDNRRLNRIFNFITVIFLQHYRLIAVRQTQADSRIWIRSTEYINVVEEIWA